MGVTMLERRQWWLWCFQTLVLFSRRMPDHECLVKCITMLSNEICLLDAVYEYHKTEVATGITTSSRSKLCLVLVHGSGEDDETVVK